MESSLSQIHPAVTELQTFVQQNYSLIQNIWSHVDDLEDRTRRNNVRLRGIPEATSAQDLRATVVGIFNTLMNKPVSEHVELDRVHRTPGYRNPNMTRPRDVLCRVHYYTVKEEIMTKAQTVGTLDFDGAQISFFPDLSRCTLAKRRALRPLTKALQEAGIPYRWGYPFSLSVRRNGKIHIFKQPSDLQLFLAELNLSALS